MESARGKCLQLKGVVAGYGRSEILHGISLMVMSGRITCLLGLNGMGKTTTLRAVMGILSLRGGELWMDGVLLTGNSYVRARHGLTLVPEDRKVFKTLTVYENLLVAARQLTHGGFTVEEVWKIFPRLKERAKQLAGTLSGGEQQMLVVGRALVQNPRYIMLDEPTEGLAPEYVEVIGSTVELAAERGIGVLLVEQSIPLATNIGHDFYTMNEGLITHYWTRAELLERPELLERELSIN